MFRADCARCAALCCVALAFDRSALFGFDKPAGVACAHLTPDDACKIHVTKERRGFAGCVRYDCAGAGQRVTQEVFGGRSWRNDAPLAREMFAAFRAVRRVHELLLLLRTARLLPPAPAQSERRSALESALSPAEGWSPQSLDAFERGDLSADVEAFLAGLRDRVPRAWQAQRRLPVVP